MALKTFDVRTWLRYSLIVRKNESTESTQTTNDELPARKYAVRSKPTTVVQTTLPAAMTIKRNIRNHDGDDGSDSGDDTNSQCSCPACKYASDQFDPEMDEIEKQIERKNRLFVVDEQGVMHWLQHELTYTRAEIIRRQGVGPTYMYDFASPQELRKWVRDRSLPDPYPRGLTLRYMYIRLLEQADAEWTFRFLDLPPEMRLLIYAELLTFRRCTSCPRVHEACHTGILRASKQVYREARDILYGDNVIRCVFAAGGYDYIPESWFSIMHVKETHGHENSMDRVFLGMSQCPEWLRRIEHLRIDLDFSGGSISEAGFKLQTCLLNFATFLMDEHNLKKLEVHISNSAEADSDDDESDDDGEDVAERLDAIIYPLRRLSGIQRVEIDGVNKGLAKHTAALMQRMTAPRFNTLQHLNNLREEAKAFAKVMNSADPLNYGRDVPLGHGGHVSHDLELLVAELGDYEDMDELYDPFADAEAETNTRRKMEELKDCLAKLQFTDFEKRKEEFLKLRKARAAYQTKTKWVYVDGKKKADRGLRRDWDSRLEDEYDW